MVQEKKAWMYGLVFGTLAVLAMVAVLAPSTSAAADGDIAGEHVGLVPGDYFEYDLDASAMIEALIAGSGSSSAVAKDVSTSYKETVKGAEEVSGIDAWSVDQEMMVKCTIVDEEQQMTSKVDMSSVRHVWIGKGTFRPVKVEEEQRSTIFLLMGEGPTATSDSIETRSQVSTTYTVTDDASPFPMRVGNAWNTTETLSVRTVESSRYMFAGGPWSEWDSYTTEEEVVENVSYVVLSLDSVETPAGTFEAFKVASSNVSGPQRGTSYIDVNGLVVRMDMYEDGAPSGVLQLKGYRFQNGIDTDDDGSVDAKDAFPTDRSASVDSDDDGYPDSWNEGMSASDSTSGLSLDKYPEDPARWEDPSDSPVEIWVVLVCLGAMGVVAAVRRRT